MASAARCGHDLESLPRRLEPRLVRIVLAGGATLVVEDVSGRSALPGRPPSILGPRRGMRYTMPARPWALELGASFRRNAVA